MKRWILSYFTQTYEAELDLWFISPNLYIYWHHISKISRGGLAQLRVKMLGIEPEIFCMQSTVLPSWLRKGEQCHIDAALWTDHVFAFRQPCPQLTSCNPEFYLLQFEQDWQWSTWVIASLSPSYVELHSRADRESQQVRVEFVPTWLSLGHCTFAIFGQKVSCFGVGSALIIQLFFSVFQDCRERQRPCQSGLTLPVPLVGWVVGKRKTCLARPCFFPRASFCPWHLKQILHTCSSSLSLSPGTPIASPLRRFVLWCLCLLFEACSYLQCGAGVVRMQTPSHTSKTFPCSSLLTCQLLCLFHSKCLKTSCYLMSIPEICVCCLAHAHTMWV